MSIYSRPLDSERLLQRVECTVTNYPYANNTLELVERAVPILERREEGQLFDVSGKITGTQSLGSGNKTLCCYFTS